MILLFLLWWHTTLLSWDEEELHERSVDGSASDEWACAVMHRNRWRRLVIARIRRKSRLLRFGRVVRVAVRLYFRPVAA